MKRLVGQICSHLITLLLQGQSALWPHKNDEGTVRWNVVQLGWICLTFIQTGVIFVSPTTSAHLMLCPNVIHCCLGTSVGFNDVWLACVFGLWSDVAPEPVAMATNRLRSYSPHVFFFFFSVCFNLSASVSAIGQSSWDGFCRETNALRLFSHWKCFWVL